MALGRRGLIGALGGMPLAARAATMQAPRPATMPTALTMATGAPGGGFALYGPAWGMAAARAARIAISYRASGGSAANILLVEQGTAQLGMVTGPVADQAWNGDGGWTGGVRLRGFRALFPIFGASLQVVAPLDGRVRRLSDLAGRRVGLGPAGGSGAALVPRLLAAARLAPRTFLDGLFAEQIELLHKGRIDACAFFGATPLPALRTAATHGGYRLIGPTDAEIGAMRRAVPGLERVTIPRGSLQHLTAPVASIGAGAIAIGRADLPDEIAASVTEAALAGGTTLLHGLPGAAELPTGWLAGVSPIEIHPGAAPVLRRHGYAAPGRLIRG